MGEDLWAARCSTERYSLVHCFEFGAECAYTPTVLNLVQNAHTLQLC